MAGTLVSLLADFSPPAEAEPSKPAINHQAEMRSLESRVRAEEQQIARTRLEEALAAEKARYEQEINAQREIWVEQQAIQMSAQIQEALGRINFAVSERVANILRPFVSEAYRQQSLNEFREALATLLLGDVTKLVKITGPEDLLTALKAQLGSYESRVEFCPSEHVEVCVVAQDTKIQTQFDAWSSRLRLASRAD
jgi:vacuolar-type H+-ATPase subunit I/STV1